MSGDPMEFLDDLAAVMEAVCRRCSHCRVRVELMPGAGGRHVLGETHEPGCPLHVSEDQPAAEYDTARLERIYGIESVD